MPPEVDAPAITAPRAPKRRLSLAAKIISAVIGLVGAVTGVVSILPILQRDASSLDSLTVTVEPIVSSAVSFAVPVSAPWAEFPGSMDRCSDEQLAWLQVHGRPMQERYLIEVTNTAKEGATLSLKDFRGVGAASESAQRSVSVVCDSSGVPSQLRAASLDPATGAPAEYEQNNPNIPDNPLVYNLAPGETGQIAFSLRSALDFGGQIIATVALGGEERDAVLPFDKNLTVVGVASDPARFTIAGGALTCIADAACVPLDLLARLAD